MTANATILVADDEAMNVELLKAILTPDHFRVITASNGAETLDILAKEKVDLLLLDVMMPKIDGFEVTRRIRANKKTKNLPVILITALRETEERITGIEAGCDEFVTKPFDKHEVLARIKTLLRLNYYRSQIDEKERLEQVINKMNDGLIVCDAEGKVDRFNQKSRELLNDDDLSAGWLERLGKSFKIGYPGDLAGDLRVRALELDLERPETTATRPLILSFSSSLIQDTDGKTVSIVILLHDVTRQRKEQFEKEDFLSLMYKKLRIPLALSLEHLALLQKSTASMENQPFKKSVDITVDKVTEFLREVEKIFDFLAANAPARYGEKGVEKVDLRMQQVEALIKAAVQKFPGRKIECKMDLPSGLGLPISEELFTIILDNLVENAVKFNNQALAKIGFSVALDGGYVRFTINDNGPGIPSEEKRNIFNTFYQIGKYGAEAAKGLGLGLAIVDKIVKASHGKIRVDHPADGGASISVAFPLPAKG
jgi:DNA-binding response OmpR family regulator/two-component sensor histidine kinase